ncbi:deaminase [Brevibacillus fluminis]|uniref:Deaminase n=1 Tax=Brevibacillus fluminis TaxID=511487 RepID=A0A3M8D5A8_9BACL|nr:amidohydrolase [Brevibacillus fluminis]RNB82395.1 deaminase [Brevibacillus fluminis]
MTVPYWLKNVRLESGYAYEGGMIVATEHELSHLLIDGDKIARIESASVPLDTDLPVIDAGGLLMLPSFAEMHIHLDKTFYSGPWQAVIPAKNRFFRIQQEEQLLPLLLPTAQERAENILALITSTGATHVRTHCNIDSVIGLKNLETTMRALETFKGKLSHEIVAFPQHGLLRSKVVPLMREAMKNGATLVGGLDPATFDENIEASLHTMMELAVEADADVDIHLHEPTHLGVFIIKRLAALTEEAGWQGRVTISHAYGLGEVPAGDAAAVAELLAALGITIASSVPYDIPTIPIPLLHEKGVKVQLGTDNLTDNWDPFGKGDMLEKANVLAQRFRWIDERSLAKALGFITGGKLPLDDDGNRQWPKVGDSANAVFVHASSSAEAVARIAKRQAIMYKGNVIAGSFPAAE